MSVGVFIGTDPDTMLCASHRLRYERLLTKNLPFTIYLRHRQPPQIYFPRWASSPLVTNRSDLLVVSSSFTYFAIFTIWAPWILPRRKDIRLTVVHLVRCPPGQVPSSCVSSPYMSSGVKVDHWFRLFVSLLRPAFNPPLVLSSWCWYDIC